MYRETVVRYFLHESEFWQPCPHAGCTNAVYCSDPQRGRRGAWHAFDVVCECSHRFCGTAAARRTRSAVRDALGVADGVLELTISPTAGDAALDVE